jgi:hypothetical protein
MKQTFWIISIFILLESCAIPNYNNYHDVSGVAWDKLNSEQKQMVIDQSFQDFINSGTKNNKR